MEYIAILEDEHIVRIGDKPCLHCFNGLMHDYYIPVKERKVGKWIYDRGAYICPFCEHKMTGLEKDLNYCCKCGAEMRGCEE